MKAKKLEKKLTLNKATIVNLNNDQMDSARGGTAPTIEPCTNRICTRPIVCDTEWDCGTSDLC